jgi:hypothetical protein
MIKILLAITTAFLLNSTTAQAEIKTFNITWSGESFSNNARATGFITFDTDNFLSNGSGYQLNFSDVMDLGLTVTGSSVIAGNGNFTLSDYSYIDFNSVVLLDFSRELIGQPVSVNEVFGQVFTSSASLSDFTITNNGINNLAPTARWYHTLETAGSERMLVTSINPVPEADTSAMLLMGAGLMGFIARRRKQAAA